MFRNALAVLCSSWLFLAPTLCAAGVLTHACDCSSGIGECETCCGSEELGCDCVDDGCSHDNCANDPCQVGIAVEKQSSVALDFANQAAFAACDAYLDWDFAFLHARPTASSGPPGSGKHLPYHLSDIPLLV